MTRKRAGAAAGPFDTYDYWLMPHGLRGLMTTIFWPGALGGRRRSRRRVNQRHAGVRSPLPGPLRPFAILAPGKTAREIGEHTFWGGSLWGRSVALQGDSSFSKYDLFDVTPSGLLYWGTFRGNGYYGSEESHSFRAPFDTVITTDGGDEGTSPWKIALRGKGGGGDADADFVISSDYIPVTPGRRYRLSGSLWRVSPSDNVYLDFNDGAGQGGNFPDAQAMSKQTQVWERVSAETTVGPTTTAIKVRCVRDGANAANAYCDAITLQHVG